MPVDIVQLKIEWAKKHIDKVERCLSHLIHDVKPYQFALKDDADKRESVLYVKRAQEIPLTLKLLLGDAISNLYSPLDYLACELVAREEDVSRDTAFPISEIVPQFRERVPSSDREKSRYERQVSGMGKNVEEEIKNLQPYRGRDNNFWTLHKLNNINKHRTLVTAGHGVAVNSPGRHWETHVALQEGAELLRVPMDSPDKDDITLIPLVAINEPEADVVNHPLLNVLRGCLRDVERAAAALRQYRRAHSHLFVVSVVDCG